MKFWKHVTFEWGPIENFGQKQLQDICLIEVWIFFLVHRLSLGVGFLSSNILRRIVSYVSRYQYRFHMRSIGNTLHDRFESMWYYAGIPQTQKSNCLDYKDVNTRLHPQGKGGPEGTSCVGSTQIEKLKITIERSHKFSEWSCENPDIEEIKNINRVIRT